MASWKDIRVLSKKDMDKRIARFSKLKGSDGGLPDSPLPECKRTLYAVIGLVIALSAFAIVNFVLSGL